VAPVNQETGQHGQQKADGPEVDPQALKFISR